jgi:CHAT domain-containing protein/tetratricopeptide (TPR) repeat protein
MRSAVSRSFVAFLVIVSSAVPAFGETAESVVRRFLALAYEGRFDELPKAPAARMERFERQVRNVMRVRCIRADQIAIPDVEERTEQVTLHADMAMAKRDPHSSGDWSAVEIVPFRFELVRQGDSWLVAEVRNRDEEHAEHLLQASGGERERRLREQPERLSKGLARALYARSLAHLNSGKFKEAADASAMALQVAREVGDRGGEALALGAATYTLKSTDVEGLMRLSQESLDIARTTGDPDVLARAWYDRGRSFRPVRSERGSNDVAEVIESYRNARRLAERAEDPSILIRVLYSLANIAANRQSDYLSARRYIDEGIALAREVGDVTGEMGLQTVLSTVYFHQKDLERGLVHHALATDLAEKTQAFAYPSLLLRSGTLLVELGRYDEARAMFARVLVRNETGLMTTTFKSVPGSAMASALQALAEIEANSGNFSEAECLKREAGSHYYGHADAFLYELAPHYATRGNDAGALALSLASLAQDALYPHQRAEALVAVGRAYQRMGIVDRGVAAALEAIEIREALESRTAGDEQQRTFAATLTSECYELAAELTLGGGDPVGALVLLERGRARVQTDILENGRPGLAAEIDADVREQQSALDRDVVLLRTELDRAQSAGDDTIGEHSERLNHARAVRASFLDGVRARSERRDAVRRQIDAADVLGLAARLPSRTVAVEYFVGEHELHIFVLGGVRGDEGVTVRTKRVERKTLDERVSVFLERLANNDLRVEAVSRQLYSLLIEPIEKDIAGAEGLLVVPDDSLWRVSFAALVDRRGRFLVESKAIFYAPSMTAWSSIAKARRRSGSPGGSLLAIANPTLDPAAGKIAASFYRNATLGPLPDAEREVDALRTLYDPRQSLVLTRDQATEARTKTALRDAAVAHFATHAILDDANPMYSRLMLARDGDAAEDGWLESWEVARLELNADLVVLSACETARGHVGGGEGVVGLSWSFFLAGASSTLSTQWKVASDSTAGFMIAFHRSLRAPAMNPALHKAQAVREAQLQSIGNKRTSHPFHWAPFVLLGDPSLRTEH